MNVDSTMAGNEVSITEVGPRDGLQNLPIVLSPEQRAALIESLLKAGVTSIEAGSFVSPRAVPAMARTDEVLTQINKCFSEDNDSSKKDRYLSVLIPNMRGFEFATEAKVDAVQFVVAASETMNQRNVNQSIDQSIKDLQAIIFNSENSTSEKDKVDVLACIATAWECPFEGKVNPSAVINMVGQCLDHGVTSVVLADTIGAANPASVKSLLHCLVSEFGAEKLGCHFHDTRGMALANVAIALDQGIRKFDSSIGGLGGCPFAPGATGNLATEDLVLMIQQMGMKLDIDLALLLKSVELAKELTGHCHGGHAYHWLTQHYKKETV